MRKLLVTVLLVSLLVTAGFACTSIFGGKDSTVDGSVFTTHTCDGNYDARIQIIEGKLWAEGSKVPIYQNYLYETLPGRQKSVVGEIPQVEKTFTYFHIAYPFMNEKGIIMGEATFNGRRENMNPKGMFWVEQLQAIGLQRASTAREIIQIMGDLAEKWGYADGGEALTIIDGNEAWLFEIVGAGPLWAGPDSGEPGAVWAAQRVPDDEIAVIANRSRIGIIDYNNPDFYMASKHAASFAEEMGFWSPKEGPFMFWKAYSPIPYGGRYYQQRREWRVLSLLAPSLNLDPYQAEPYPFSVKPEKKVSMADVMDMKRDFMEGTEFDLTVGLAAGPFGNPNRYPTPASVRPADFKTADWERAISMFRCSYTLVGQARSWLPSEIGSVLWFGEDAPHSTVYIPLYAGITKVPESFSKGTRTYVDRNYAWWAFNYVSNMIDLKFSYILKDVQKIQQEFEQEFFQNQPFIEKVALEMYQQSPEKAKAFLTNYCYNNATRVVERWWKLPDEIMFKYYDGSVGGTSVGYPTWWLEVVDFGEGYLQPKE